jgi:hypothetical protein
MPKEVEILKGQTLADMAVQETGWFEGLFDIAVTNGISITEEVAAGTNLNFKDTDVNEQVYRFAKLENIQPATAFGYVLTEGGEEPVLDGVEFWAIEIDFIVS